MKQTLADMETPDGIRTERWFLLEEHKGAPAWNMAMDETLLEFASELGSPVLRFYSWSLPAATFGYFQKYKEIESWTSLRPLIRRPTGGGLVPHDADWTYSLVFPPSHLWYSLKAEQSYKLAHEWVSKAFEGLHAPTQLAECCAKDVRGQCFMGAEKFDVLLLGEKIAGAAQRRNKQGLLIQGSVQKTPPNLQRSDWQEQMKVAGPHDTRIAWEAFPENPALLKRAEALAAQKYSQPAFNQSR